MTSTFPLSLSRNETSSSTVTERKGSWNASTQGRNPISLRLYKVLGSNYEDDATREALRTLSELYVAPGSSKARDWISTDAQEMDDFEDNAVRVPIEAVPGESAARARRNLRRDMENKLTEGSRQFLKAFGEVDQVCLFAYVLNSCSYHTMGRNWTNYNSISTPCE
jgi:hypothetical protein